MEWMERAQDDKGEEEEGSKMHKRKEGEKG
jgi:hypothetical protein